MTDICSGAVPLPPSLCLVIHKAQIQHHHRNSKAEGWGQRHNTGVGVCHRAHSGLLVALFLTFFPVVAQWRLETTIEVRKNLQLKKNQTTVVE